MNKIKLGFLHSVIRPEEKHLIKEFQNRADIDLILLDERKLVFNLEETSSDLDLIFDRSIGYIGSLNILRVFENFGVRCINSANTAHLCGDKLQTSLALREHRVPQPALQIAFSDRAALDAMERMGFPVVLKPAVGSWGRLLSKINDRDTALAILDHRKTLGNHNHQVYYIQRYVEKRNRDIRTIVVGDECVAATYRSSDHWITNVARGGRSSHSVVSPEIRDLSLQAAKAVGGGILSVDLFETESGFLVNEVNHTMEFKGCMEATGVNIPAIIADHLVKQVKQEPLPLSFREAVNPRPPLEPFTVAPAL